MKAWFQYKSRNLVYCSKKMQMQQNLQKNSLLWLNKPWRGLQGRWLYCNLQPITKIHLDTTLPAGIEPISNPKYSYILLTIGILICLLLVSIFITLSVGRSATRAWKLEFEKCWEPNARNSQAILGRSYFTHSDICIIGVCLSVLLVKPFNQIINRN
jgi:putative ABC transport system permease protein